MKKQLLWNNYTIPYELERKRVKNLNLRIRPDGTVHVSAPYFTPQSSIDRCLLRYADRILDALRRREQRAAVLPEDSGTMLLRGQPIPVVLQEGKRSHAALEDDRILLTLRDPEDAAARSAALGRLERSLAELWLRESSERIYPLFAVMGVPRPVLKFRRMKSRWGSCRYEAASLSFNTALVHVPPACVDYVVMHEYCHFIHPNHSPAFHGLMTQLIPDWKERKKLLEKYAAVL